MRRTMLALACCWGVAEAAARESIEIVSTREIAILAPATPLVLELAPEEMARIETQLAIAEENLRDAQRMLGLAQRLFRVRSVTPLELQARQFTVEWATLDLATAQAAKLGPQAENAARIRARIAVAEEELRYAQRQLQYLERGGRKGFVARVEIGTQKSTVERAALDLATAQAAQRGPEAERAARIQAQVAAAEDNFQVAQKWLEVAKQFARKGYVSHRTVEVQQSVVEREQRSLATANAALGGPEAERTAQISTQIVTAAERLRTAQELLQYSQRLAAKGYVARVNVEAQQLAVERATQDLAIAKAAEQGPEAERAARVQALNVLAELNLQSSQAMLERFERLAHQGHVTRAAVAAQRLSVERANRELAIAKAAELGPVAERAAREQAEQATGDENLSAARDLLTYVQRLYRKGFVSHLTVAALQSASDARLRAWHPPETSILAFTPTKVVAVKLRSSSRMKGSARRGTQRRAYP